ncbi:hypothetical protein [Paenibacillus sp.]|uniref:hypothetical protein n=1 Tax=Paenibacillus sp. TaxID=58172 RepID=UPI00281F8B54|nr:hypothetical protein [Paenibacillus sp.]MDR0267813.1 hypothetical protein [Paenibacillus sp.]
MADLIFINYVIPKGEKIVNNSPIKIGDGIVTSEGSAIVRHNENELNLTEPGHYLIKYTVTNFSPEPDPIETVIDLRNNQDYSTLAIGPSSGGVAFASCTAILPAMSGMNNIFKIVNHSDTALTEGARVNLTILKIS